MSGQRKPPLDELVNVLEVEQVARRCLPEMVFRSIAEGADEGRTAARNREAFDRITFRPRVLVDVTQLDLSTELFGQKLAFPILVAPMGNQTVIQPEGETATVRGAGAAKTVMVVSSKPGVAPNEIARSTGTPLWFQVEPETLPAALAAGAKAVCVTAGSDRRQTWEEIDRIRTAAKVPVLLKGVLNPADAKTAAERGLDGIIVSNHGGQYYGGAAATIEALPAIIDTAAGRLAVLVDGGFRRGTDILKALAIGAKAVLIGRPVLWGLAAYGADGVRAVLEMLQTELALALGLSGKRSLKSVDRSLVRVHRR